MKGPGKNATFNELIARAIASGKVYLCEQDAEILVEDSPGIPIHFSISPVADPTNRVLGAVLVIRMRNDAARNASFWPTVSSMVPLWSTLTLPTLAMKREDRF